MLPEPGDRAVFVQSFPLPLSLALEAAVLYLDKSLLLIRQASGLQTRLFKLHFFQKQKINK